MTYVGIHAAFFGPVFNKAKRRTKGRFVRHEREDHICHSNTVERTNALVIDVVQQRVVKYIQLFRKSVQR